MHRLLERRLPIVTETHLPRCHQRLGVVPRELTLGEHEELLWRVAKQLVLEIADESFATSGATSYGLVGRALVELRYK
jgi:hypothetical protein